jgi:hypothetical protein
MDIDQIIPEQVWHTLEYRLSDRTHRDLRIQTEECVKFLTITSGHKLGAFVPIVREIDEIWHELILQTRFYMDFCASLPGGNYIHHETIPFDEYRNRGELVGKGSRTLIAEEFANWIGYYISGFGPFDEERAAYWSICQYLRDTFGLTLEQINQVGGRQ